MGPYTLLKFISRLLLPFVMIFGIYIVLNGDLSPGGGFQGGVVLAALFVLLYFIAEENRLDIEKMIRIEKILFLILIFVVAVAQFFHMKAFRVPYLIVLNGLIGMKVALGIGAIIMIFVGEGDI